MPTDAEHMIMEQEGTGPYRNGHFYPYQDPLGKATVGYGHNLDAKGIPEAVAHQLLMCDLADALDDVRACVSVYDSLSRPRQLVLISLAFNLGKARLMGFVHFLNSLHQGDYNQAAAELLDSLAAKQAPVRYGQLAKMMKDDTSQWV